MTKKRILAMTLSLLLILCLSGCGRKEASLGTESTAITETSDAAVETTENDPSDGEDFVVDLPEDNGIAGIYKWIEMEEYGVPTYLLLWDDGIGSIDIIGTGTVRGVFYDDETMQVADEGTVSQMYTYADDTITWTYTDADGEHVSTFVRLTAEERAAYEALGVGNTADGTGERKGNTSPWPDDNGGLAGVYKWVEMEQIGITANLIIFDDGIGVFDMLGAVESVKYDDDTMQVSGEGALPQNYTYEDGTLTWVCTSKDGEQVSTFVKLTEEELAEYEARGIGNAE